MDKNTANKDIYGAINLCASPNNEITSNSIKSATGIIIEGSSDNTKIINNNIKNNEIGISAISENLSVESNTIEKGEIGILKLSNSKLKNNQIRECKEKINLVFS